MIRYHISYFLRYNYPVFLVFAKLGIFTMMAYNNISKDYLFVSNLNFYIIHTIKIKKVSFSTNITFSYF